MCNKLQNSVKQVASKVKAISLLIHIMMHIQYIHVFLVVSSFGRGWKLMVELIYTTAH